MECFNEAVLGFYTLSKTSGNKGEQIISKRTLENVMTGYEVVIARGFDVVVSLKALIYLFEIRFSGEDTSPLI